MLIKIPELKKNPDSLIIEHLPPRKLSSKYKKDRNETFAKKVASAAEIGKEFWDGELYSFEGIKQDGLDDPTILLGEMLYSDRLLKRDLNLNEIETKYGKDHLLIHCVTGCIIITEDQKIVAGVKKASVDLELGILGHVSGNLNRDEGIKVNKMEDLYRYITMEIEEETAIKVDRSKLEFIGISLFNSAASFDFIYELPLHSSKIDTIHRDGEFMKLTTMTIEEVLKSEDPSTSDFEHSKGYLLEVIKNI